MNNQALKIASLCVSTAVIVGCGGGGGGGSSSSTGGSGFTNISLSTAQTALTSLADAIQAQVQIARNEAADLVTATQNYCTAVALDENASIAGAQSSWRDAMNAWQQVELFNFGPLADNSANLRVQTYSWPSTNTCQVDQAVVDLDDNSATFDISSESPLRKGFDAAEYLLFDTDVDHSCTNNADVNSATNGDWNARTTADRRIARCAYLEDVSEDIVANIDTLIDAWTGAGNNFRTQFTTAGNGSTRYSTAREAFDDVSVAAYYLENEVKDTKIAGPAGIGLSGAPQTAGDPGDVESEFANNSLANIIANYEGFIILVDDGFEPLLDDIGMGSIADDMIANANNAIANINTQIAVPTDLATLVTGLDQTDCTNSTSANRIEEACALFADAQAVTDILKADFDLALRLEIPASAAGDTD